MATVGIIANPASGRDIRRLVAQGAVFDNNEKVNILRRALKALDALNIQRVLFMPDYGGLGLRAVEGIQLRLEVGFLEMPIYGDARDSITAARRFAELKAACVIVLGGDGTNRAVARGSCEIPIVPISTGTNNVFPSMVEGTVAGLAAGVVAAGLVQVEEVTYRAKILELFLDGELADVALVDVASTRELFIGSRALWDPSQIREAVLASVRPGTIGLSAVGSYLGVPADDGGMYLRFGPGGRRVLAPIAPGLVVPLEVQEYRRVEVGEEILLASGNGTIALDGERELELGVDQDVRVRLSGKGPIVVDISEALRKAALGGAFDLVGS